MREEVKASVVGAGVMGSGIAIACALKGFRVSLNDISMDILDNSRKHIRDVLEYLWSNKILLSEEPSSIMDRILFEADVGEAVRDSDIVFESVPEKLDIKREVFKSIGRHVGYETILASNTSVIKIGEIAEGLDVRDRIIGVHWMNPPFILPLVEVAPSKYTREDIVERSIHILRDRLGKVIVKTPDIAGYIVNRFNAAIISEAVKLVDEGVSIEDIDMVWRNHLGLIYLLFGPFKNMDYIGLDTVYLAGIYLSHELGRELIYIPKWFEDMVLNGRLGVKSGEGFYNYKEVDAGKLYFERIKELYEVLRWLRERS